MPARKTKGQVDPDGIKMVFIPEKPGSRPSGKGRKAQLARDVATIIGAFAALDQLLPKVVKAMEEESAPTRSSTEQALPVPADSLRSVFEEALHQASKFRLDLERLVVDNRDVPSDDSYAWLSEAIRSGGAIADWERAVAVEQLRKRAAEMRAAAGEADAGDDGDRKGP